MVKTKNQAMDVEGSSEGVKQSQGRVESRCGMFIEIHAMSKGRECSNTLNLCEGE